MIAYFYTTEEIAREVLSSGLKLSDAATGKVSVYGREMPCLETYLHPGDAPAAGDPSAVILKLRPQAGKAFVADSALCGAWYDRSVMPFEKYRLGLYRRPRCLLVASVFPENVTRYDARRDEALLYESSEQLYTDALFQSADDADPAFRTAALRGYYAMQCAAGAYRRIDTDSAVLYQAVQTGAWVCFPPEGEGKGL